MLTFRGSVWGSAICQRVSGALGNQILLFYPQLSSQCAYIGVEPVSLSCVIAKNRLLLALIC